MSADTTPTPAAESPGASGRPGRYPRTSGGLVGSLLVTVVVIIGLYAATQWTRDTPTYEPEVIDLELAVEAAEGAGVDPIYPTALPEGWIATGLDLDPADPSVFGLRMLTPDEEFVGIRVEDASTTALVEQWIDEEASESDPYLPAAPDALDPQWEGFVDAGGDTGYVGEVGDRRILVYGNASAEEIQGVIDTLSAEPIEG